VIDADAVIETAGSYVGSSHVLNAVIDKYSVASSAPVGKDQVKPLIIELGRHAVPIDDPFYGLDSLEGLKKAKEWGQLVVFAHPLTGNRSEMLKFYTNLFIPLLVDNGLGGIEVRYPEHDEPHLELLMTLADKYGLIVTGGSDFHRKADVEYRIGSCGVNLAEFDAIAKRAARK